MTELVVTYPQGFMTWLGPMVPLINLCHPDIIRSVLGASGTHGSCWWCVCGNLRTSSPDFHSSVCALQQPKLPFLYLSQVFCFFVYLSSHVSLFFLYSSHFLSPHPRILGTPGMPGDHEQGSVLEEPNLEETLHHL